MPIDPMVQWDPGGGASVEGQVSYSNDAMGLNPTPPNEQTDTTENLTLPQTTYAGE